MIYINRFFFKIFDQLRNFYLNSNVYDKKISKVENKELIYKPSPHLLSSLIQYQKKKFKIENFSLDEIWEDKKLSNDEYKNLHNFYWFFSLDLKSSKKTTQSVISNWIRDNHKYNNKSWNFDVVAKRIIAWLSCHNLTYDEGNKEYINNLNKVIQKQTNHLINEINKSKEIDGKLIGCASIILVGLCYQNEKNYLSFGLSILKKISKSTLDNHGFPFSRNIKQLVFYLKYFILIREWFKESQTLIPEHIDETIYYLGQNYALVCQDMNSDYLFNGNNISNNNKFDNYLKQLGYKFRNDNHNAGGYTILKNKKISLIMDVGSTPQFKYTKDYQSGALSFEIVSNGKKLITNCGYYKKNNITLNELSKSTAAQSTLTIDDNSSCKFTKYDNYFLTKKGLKIIQKDEIFEKNYWKVSASHDGYLKKYNSIHKREIEFYPKQMVFLGLDRIIKKKTNFNLKFDIRFHIEPNIKLMKTQNNKTILIELNDEGWKFTCENYDINIDNGLYFGKKNLYTENQNIFISGISNNQIENIKWEIKKLK